MSYVSEWSPAKREAARQGYPPAERKRDGEEFSRLSGAEWMGPAERQLMADCAALLVEEGTS